MPRALISVSDKTDVVRFSRALAERGYELVSTGGTARTLADAGLPVIAVSDVTGVPEMMDGRVKTLHPRVHGGILARRAHQADLAAATEHGIALIDLVAVNLYPFSRAADNPDTPFDALIEEIDIGGPSMVRAAAKNFTDVLIVVSPADYDEVLAEIDRRDGPSLAYRFSLACKAFSHTAAYDSAIAATLGGITVDGTGFHRPAASPFPESLTLSLVKRGDLRYGENPHQPAAWYADAATGTAGAPPPGLGSSRLVQGKELSYTNLLDLDAAARIVLEFSEPAAAVIKHTNPCGVAIGVSAGDAYVRARDADALSAFGGIVGLNRVIDTATAQAIVSTKIDCVIAPGADDDALAVLARRSQMRVVLADLAAIGPGLEFRSVVGAMLVQARDRVVEGAEPWPRDGMRVVTKRQPDAQEWQALRFAWRVCAHVKSNTVIFTSADRTLAVGAGQMSRVDSVNVATMKAGASGVSLRGSAVASDAFFPFRDGLDAVANAGATVVVQPGGSVKDADVIAAADERGLAMVFTGTRHFRH